MLNLPITAAAPSPAANGAAGAAPAAPNAEPGAFARELAAQRTVAPPPGAEAPAPAPAAKDAKAKPRAEAERGNKGERSKDGARKSEGGSASGATSEAERAPAAVTKDDAPAADLQALLAHLMHPGAATAAEAKADAPSDAANAVAEAAERPGAGPAKAGRQPPIAGADAEHERQAAFVLPQQPAANAAPVAEPPAASAPAAYAAQIQAPVGSPEFAPDLSAQVSLMVRDGLQEAKLQLNPVEMGPITVQIQVDGGTAQVTMTAEQAPTRDALEQAMPQLAGALREEGLTLTGGGVFEQPRQARDGEPGSQPGRGGRGNGGGGEGDDAVAAAPARRAVARGAVDVYA